MASSTSERLLDEQGGEWVFETVMQDGYAEVYLTGPGVERRRLRPCLKVNLSRPSVDSEQPLPLDL